MICYASVFYIFKSAIFVHDVPRTYGKSSNGCLAKQRHGSFTPTVVLTEPPSLGTAIYGLWPCQRSTCDWTGVSLAPLPVIALPVATRYL